MKNGNFIDGVIGKDNLWELIFKKESGSLRISGKKIANKDIIAFQNDRKYYRKNTGNVFCKRIVKGNINVYEKKGQGENGNGRMFTYSLFFLQKGPNEKVIDFDKKTLLSMVSDFPPASHWLADGVFKKKNQDWYFNNAIRC